MTLSDRLDHIARPFLPDGRSPPPRWALWLTFACSVPALLLCLLGDMRGAAIGFWLATAAGAPSTALQLRTGLIGNLSEAERLQRQKARTAGFAVVGHIAWMILFYLAIASAFHLPMPTSPLAWLGVSLALAMFRPVVSAAALRRGTTS